MNCELVFGLFAEKRQNFPFPVGYPTARCRNKVKARFSAFTLGRHRATIAARGTYQQPCTHIHPTKMRQPSLSFASQRRTDNDSTKGAEAQRAAAPD